MSPHSTSSLMLRWHVAGLVRRVLIPRKYRNGMRNPVMLFGQTEVDRVTGTVRGTAVSAVQRTQSETMPMSLCAPFSVALNDALSHRLFVCDNFWLIDASQLQEASTRFATSANR